MVGRICAFLLSCGPSENCRPAILPLHSPTTANMALNKKQKKQIEALKNKMQKAQTLLSAAKNQPDDPADVPRLEKEVAGYQAEIEKIKNA
ncbi:hypothetical protein Fuma_04372 [Fuerstiella marisgermanici]|uniref:Uncharacterized protein n=2 Tax=Fuerstiella marisgermanici TaxID=1891926 RepID=A0A1P8WL15_9PLAN|nr:hypothetical protein Fuma_04372 [Fuerstiella marisgermanici]